MLFELHVISILTNIPLLGIRKWEKQQQQQQR